MSMRQGDAILVTGGAGFMGSHVVDAILAEPALPSARVTVLDDLSGGVLSNVPRDERVDFVRGGVEDVELVARLFAERRFRYVYHLAAYAAEGLSHFIRRFNYANNLLGSVNLINAAVNQGCECFVFTSSIAVYGHGRSPLSEDDPPTPADPYGIAKLAVEWDLAAARQTHGLPYVIFRPHNVYGPRQNLADKYRNVVGIFMNRLLNGLPMPIFGDGTQTRAFTYIGDIAAEIARSPLNAAAINGTFNLGSDHPETVNRLAELVADAMGMPAATVHLPPRQEVHVAYCDHARARRVFPAINQTPLAQGLSSMAAWAKRTPIPPPQNFEPIEIEAGLPPSWRE